jgi:hypothetical protein
VLDSSPLVVLMSCDVATTDTASAWPASFNCVSTVALPPTVTTTGVD